MKTKSGFTLIELLIVMGILFLLGILTVGVMTSVRTRSNESVCISNLHQIGLGVRMYMEDYDAKPAVLGVPMSLYDLGLPPSDSFILFRDKYVGSKKVFYCPAYHDKTPIKELATTYEDHMMRRPADIEEVKPWIAKKGDQYALFICHEHFPGNPFATNVPSWQRRKVNILRLNGQVDSKMYPMPPLSYNY